MLVVRCTATLLKKLRAIPAAEPAGPDTTTLGEWYAKEASFGRTRYVAFMNAASHTGLVVDAAPAAGLFDRFREQLEWFLYVLGVDNDTIAREIKAAQEMVIAKTTNRSTLGSLNQFVNDLIMFSDMRIPEDRFSREELQARLAFRIDSAIDNHPVDVARARFGLPRPGDLHPVDPPPGSILVRRLHGEDFEFFFARLGQTSFDAFQEILVRLQAGCRRVPQLLLERFIRKYPEDINAIAMLADVRERQREGSSLRLLQHAVAVGRSAFPRDFRLGHDRLPWTLLGNRPYLRACSGLAVALAGTGKLSEAEALCLEALMLNPDDNTGVRQLVVDVRLRLDDDAGALEICDLYPGDTGESILYGRVLALYRSDRKAEARAALESAIATLPRVGQELARPTHIPPAEMFEGVVVANGADQAWLYWMQNGTEWTRTPGAIEFVASFLAEARAARASGSKTNVVPLWPQEAIDPHMDEFLNDAQVTALASELRDKLAADIPGLARDAADEYATGIVRYRQLANRICEAREALDMSIKDVAGLMRVPLYRLYATEEAYPWRIKPEVFWDYCDLLGLRAFALRWIDANRELADRLGIVSS